MKQFLWLQPHGMRRRYELRDAEQSVATVSVDGYFSPIARVRSGTDDWTMKRSGVWRSQVTVREARSKREILVVHGNWSGHYAVDGLRWKSSNIWQSEFAWTRLDGTPLIRYRGRCFWRTGESIIDVLDTSEPRILLLTIVGAYLRILTLDDAAAVVVAAS